LEIVVLACFFPVSAHAEKYIGVAEIKASPSACAEYRRMAKSTNNDVSKKVQAYGSNWNSGYNWSMKGVLSQSEGLRLERVFLGPGVGKNVPGRNMAHSMSLPSYDLTTTANATPVRRYLSPSQCFRRRASKRNASRYTVKANYLDSKTCLTLQQEYQFTRPQKNVEPHKLSSFNNPDFFASRFFPKVRYSYVKTRGEKYSDFKVKVHQKFDFVSDAAPKQTIKQKTSYMVEADVTALAKAMVDYSQIGVTTFGEYDGVTGPDLPNDRKFKKAPFRVIEKGKSLTMYKRWEAMYIGPVYYSTVLGSQTYLMPDNYHQTWKDQVSRPGVGVKIENGKPIPIGLHPGCPECIHIHWRWTNGLKPFENLTGYKDFEAGKPLIRPGSQQTVELHTDDDLNFWYVSTGTQNWDLFFNHGGFYAPKGITRFSPK
jgi:hypothetical protein